MEVISFLQSFSSDFLNFLMLFITSFGSLYFSILVVCIIYWCYNKEVGYKMALIVSCSSVLNNIVKGLVQSARPIGSEGIFSLGEFSATGYSFPSGHAQNITVTGVTLCIFTRNKLIFLATFVLVVLVGISRIYLGLHWPIDILGGIVLSLIVSIVLNEVLAKLNYFKIKILVLALILFFCFGMTFIKMDAMGQDYFKSMGLLAGIYLGHLFEDRYVYFTSSASNFDNVMKIIIGVFTTLLIDFLFTYFLKNFYLIHIIKYMVIGFWIIGGVPFIFKVSNLYYKEAYEIINVKYRK